MVETNNLLNLSNKQVNYSHIQIGSRWQKMLFISQSKGNKHFVVNQKKV